MDTSPSLSDVSHVGDVTVVAIRSSLIKEGQVPELRRLLEALVARGCLKLVLDLSQVECLSAAVLGMLARLVRDATQSLGPDRGCPPPGGEVTWHCGGWVLFPDRESAIAGAEHRVGSSFARCNRRSRSASESYAARARLLTRRPF
jgi:hypothetical protein